MFKKEERGRNRRTCQFQARVVYIMLHIISLFVDKIQLILVQAKD